jgi:hypothetical protein
LDIKVRASDPLKPVIVVTNNSGKACQVANTAVGTVSLTRVEQDGKPIAPIPVHVTFPDGLLSALAQRLQTLEPGKSAEIKLPVVKAGPTGQALEMVTGGRDDTYAALFPITAGKPLTIDLAYNVPLPADEKTPLCAPGFSSGSLADKASTSRPKWMIYGAVGAGVLLLLLLVVFLLLRRKKTAAATVLLLMASVGLLTEAKPALAVFDVDPSLQSAFNDCMTVFQQPGHDPAHLLDDLNSPDWHAHIIPTGGDIIHTGGTDTDSFTFWDPTERHEYGGGGGFSDPCTTLYHELHHAHGYQQHNTSFAPAPQAIPAAGRSRKTSCSRRARKTCSATRSGCRSGPNTTAFPYPMARAVRRPGHSAASAATARSRPATLTCSPTTANAMTSKPPANLS